MLPLEVKLIIDLSLGDGYIGGSDAKGYYYRCVHSIKQRDYVDHKAEMFRNIGFTVNPTERFSESSFGKHFYGFVVYTKHAKTAKKYLYNQKVKTIDKNLLSMLDRRSLAYWFMDDGCVDHYNKSKSKSTGKLYTYETPFARAYRFATHAHTLQELELLCSWYYEKYAIVAKPARTNRAGQYNTSITLKPSKDIFISLIKDYVIPSMEYKVKYPHSLKGVNYTITETVRD